MQTSGDRFIMILDPFAVVTKIKDGAVVGLKLDFAYGTYIESEMAFGGSAGGFEARFVDTTLISQDPEDAYGVETSNPLGYLQLNLNVYALDFAVSPFVTGGYGRVVLNDYHSGAWNYGAGVKFRVSDRTSVRLVVRRFRTDLHTTVEYYSTSDPDPRKWGTVGVPYEDRLEFTELGACVSWAFRIR